MIPINLFANYVCFSLSFLFTIFLIRETYNFRYVCKNFDIYLKTLFTYCLTSIYLSEQKIRKENTIHNFLTLKKFMVNLTMHIHVHLFVNFSQRIINKLYNLHFHLSVSHRIRIHNMDINS